MINKFDLALWILDCYLRVYGKPQSKLDWAAYRHLVEAPVRERLGEEWVFVVAGVMAKVEPDSLTK